MRVRPFLALVPLACGLLVAGSLPTAQAAQAAPAAKYPSRVVVHDSRTSAKIVDISKVRLFASYYYDSEQGLSITVPNGFHAGHQVTVWFDVDGNSKPDGHYTLRLGAVKPNGALTKTDEFRVGGGWGNGGQGVLCSGSEGGSPAAGQILDGDKTIGLGLDLWSCLQKASPSNLGSASWRAAVRVKLGKKADMAPNGRTWSARAAGWEPCNPSTDSC